MRGGLWLALLSALACTKTTTLPATSDAACAVAATGSPPFTVTFQLRNAGATPLWIGWGACGTDLSITGCATGYAQEYGPRFHCACSCDEPSCTGGLACGPCPPEEEELPPQATRQLTWKGESITDVVRDRYTCVQQRDLPAGKYRIAVPLYTSMAAVKAKQRAGTVTRDFDLPTAGDRVDVDLALGDPDGGGR
jgi:hypothetical protein